MKRLDDVTSYNRQAWDHQVRSGNRWTIPVAPEVIAAARQGDWSVVLTPQRAVPQSWFGDLLGRDVLCLAGGGGQQGPVLAAAGANVTVFDQSRGQLEQDGRAAAREGLEIRTVCGDMMNPRELSSDSFDLVVNPCSVGFVPDVIPVWQEAFRVLRPGGRLMTGFINPLFFLFDYEALQEGILDARHSIPWSDLRDSSEELYRQWTGALEPVCFGHTLQDLLGGQLAAGFRIIDLYEDRWGSGPEAILDPYIATFLATLAEKPA